MYCPGGNATDPIWRVLASSYRISSWTPLKPQHSNPNPNTLANSDVLTSFLLPHISPSLTDSLPSLNLLCHSETDARFMQDAPKAVWSIGVIACPSGGVGKYDIYIYIYIYIYLCVYKMLNLCRGWELERIESNRISRIGYCMILA